MDGGSDIKKGEDGGSGAKEDGMDESIEKEVKQMEKGIEAEITKTPNMPPPHLLRPTTRSLKRTEAAATLAASNSIGSMITATPKGGSKRMKMETHSFGFSMESIVSAR